jgi:Fungal Zn(2)-Cys(6) binuclear cluster domain
MRACEGCRRRKIKCDSATTNTWPCAACVRLKLQCVPPSVSYEKEPTTPGIHTFELQKSQSYPQSASTLSLPEYRSVQQFDPIESPLQPSLHSPYAEVPVYHHSTDYVESVPAPDLLKYGQMQPSPVRHSSLKTSMIYSQAGIPQSATSERSWISDGGVTNLAEAFGDLQIGLNGTCE